MKYNTYLFDFDGTLVDSMPLFASLMLRILDENNVKYENDIWMNLPYNRTIYVHELQHVLKHCDIKKEIII